MIFSFTCQFSQRFDFHVIFYGDDSSSPVIDTNIWLMPNKADVLSRMIVPKSAWSSNLIGLFRIEIQILSCHTKNTAPAASFEIFSPYIKIRKPPFGRPIIFCLNRLEWNNAWKKQQNTTCILWYDRTTLFGQLLYANEVRGQSLKFQMATLLFHIFILGACFTACLKKNYGLFVNNPWEN